jgi:hypothetical protein
MKLSTLLLIGGLGAGVLWFTMKPASASPKREEPGPYLDTLRAFLDGAWGEDLRAAAEGTDRETRAMIKQFVTLPAGFNASEVAKLGLSPSGPGSLAAVIHQLEGRPDVLLKWAAAYEDVGLDAEAGVLRNKATAIRKG